MEKFPSTQPEESSKSSYAGIGKAAIIGAAMAVGMQAEAQTTHNEVDIHNATTVTVQENPEMKMQNEKIMNTLLQKELAVQKLARKTVVSHELVYAVTTESDALNRVHFNPNNMESVVMQDAEIALINNEGRNYHVATRDMNAINEILKEKELGEEFGNKEGKQTARHMMEEYNPVNFYIVVGATQDSKTTLNATIRVINMQTKEVDTYSVEHVLKREVIGEGEYQALSDAVGQKIKEIVAQH